MSGNYMKVWELDSPGDDDYIEKMTFPDCSVTLNCDYYGCDGVNSPWKNPTSWDKFHRLDAKIRLQFQWAELIWMEPIP